MGRIAEALKRAKAVEGTAEERGADRSPSIPFFSAPPTAEAAALPDSRTLNPAPTLRTAEIGEIERAREPVPESIAERLIFAPKMQALTREQYRKLAAQLHQTQADRGVKVVMLTSAMPQEGKTLTAVNLALTLSDSFGRRVLLIDADLRHPTIHEVFGVANTSGLSDALQADRTLPVLQVRPRLALVVAGRAQSDPMKTLTSDRMRQVVVEARESFDWVVVDTPPVSLLPDAHLLGPIVDVAVLVVASDRTSYDLVQHAAAVIGQDRLAGIILNRAEERNIQTGGGYYAYYNRVSHDR